MGKNLQRYPVVWLCKAHTVGRFAVDTFICRNHRVFLSARFSVVNTACDESARRGQPVLAGH